MISYRENPMAAASEVITVLCVLQRLILPHSRKRKNKAHEYLHSDVVFLPQFLDYKSRERKRNEKREDCCLAI
jgi:hypothetical protein